MSQEIQNLKLKYASTYIFAVQMNLKLKYASTFNFVVAMTFAVFVMHDNIKSFLLHPLCAVSFDLRCYFIMDVRGKPF